MSKTNSERAFDSLLLSRLEGKLYFDNLDLNTLLDEIGTPSFIFSENQLITQYDTLRRAFISVLKNPFELAFSIKSNPLADITEVFIRQKSLFEVTSLGEMQQVIKLGGDPQKIIYTNIVKPINTINFALRSGIKYLAIDSYNDMKHVEKVAKNLKKTPKILIRVNPLIELKNVVFSCAGHDSKIGIEIPDKLEKKSHLNSVISYCRKSPWLNIVGLHMHLGSQISNIGFYTEGFRKVVRFTEYLLKNGLDIEVLDIGGGFPIDYGHGEVLNPDAFSNVIQNELVNFPSTIQIIAESGRYLTAPAGILAVSVETLKKDPRGTKIACLDGSFYNTIPDVIVANWKYPIEKVYEKEKDSIQEYRIVGSSNDTLDQYRPDSDEKPTKISIKELREEERIVFLQAGAYSLSFNSSYCLEKRPKIFFIRKK